MTGQFVENRVVVRGAGEMASGVIRRLFMAGFEVVALEQESPNCIRRTVCYAEAVYQEKVTVEGVTARLAKSYDDALNIIKENCVPVLIDPDAGLLASFKPLFLIDARMLKKENDTRLDMAPVVIGLGPGFTAGKNCHAVVETNRGFNLGRVIYQGSPQVYTGIPSAVDGYAKERVWRSPADGILKTYCSIGDNITAGEVVAEVSSSRIVSQISGVIRGLARDGLKVKKDDKIGDVDPRGIKEYCFKTSDKANAVAGGVLEAVFSMKNALNMK